MNGIIILCIFLGCLKSALAIVSEAPVCEPGFRAMYCNVMQACRCVSSSSRAIQRNLSTAARTFFEIDKKRVAPNRVCPRGQYLSFEYRPHYYSYCYLYDSSVTLKPCKFQ